MNIFSRKEGGEKRGENARTGSKGGGVKWKEEGEGQKLVGRRGEENGRVCMEVRGGGHTGQLRAAEGAVMVISLKMLKNLCQKIYCC